MNLPVSGNWNLPATYLIYQVGAKHILLIFTHRSEVRRVGKVRRSWWSLYQQKTKSKHFKPLSGFISEVFVLINLNEFLKMNSILAFDILFNAANGPDLSHHLLLNKEHCSISFLFIFLIL